MSPPPFRLKQPVQREHPLQEALTKVLRLEITRERYVSRLGVTWFSMDHANNHGEVPGVRQARGVVAGLPDCWFLWQGKWGVIELKALDGSLRPEQCQCLAAFGLVGGHIAVANDSWQVLQILDAWGVPRNNRTRISG